MWGCFVYVAFLTVFLQWFLLCLWCGRAFCHFDLAVLVLFCDFCGVCSFCFEFSFGGEVGHLFVGRLMTVGWLFRLAWG